MKRTWSRRRLLGSIGATTIIGISGCQGGGDGGRTGETQATDDGSGGDGETVATTSTEPLALRDVNWTNYQRDPGHSGDATDMTGPVGPVSERWRLEAEVPNSFPGIYPPSPVIGAGAIYAMGFDGTVYAIDGTGETRWTHGMSSPLHGSLTYHDGYVFASDGVSGSFLALNAEDGSVEWRESLGDVPVPSVGNGALFVAAMETDTLQCLNPSNGSERWQYRASTLDGETFVGQPAVVEGTAYVVEVGADGLDNPEASRLHAIDTGDGSRRWIGDRFEHRSDVLTTVADRTVVITDGVGTVHAVETSDGSIRWSHSGDNARYTSAAIADGRIYISDKFGRLEALSLDAGGVVWSIDRNDERNNLTTPVVTTDAAYVGGTSRTTSPFLQAYNPEDGSLLWEYPEPETLEDGEIKRSYTPAVVGGSLVAITVGERWSIVALGERD